MSLWTPKSQLLLRMSDEMCCDPADSALLELMHCTEPFDKVDTSPRYVYNM